MSVEERQATADGLEQPVPPGYRGTGTPPRQRMRRQAWLLMLVAFSMLLTTFAVPFALRYLQIRLP